MVRGRAPRLFCCAAVRALGVAVVLACDVAARVGASSSALAPRGLHVMRGGGDDRRRSWDEFCLEFFPVCWDWGARRIKASPREMWFEDAANMTWEEEDALAEEIVAGNQGAVMEGGCTWRVIGDMLLLPRLYLIISKFCRKHVHIKRVGRRLRGAPIGCGDKRCWDCFDHHAQGTYIYIYRCHKAFQPQEQLILQHDPSLGIKWCGCAKCASRTTRAAVDQLFPVEEERRETEKEEGSFETETQTQTQTQAQTHRRMLIKAALFVALGREEEGAAQLDALIAYSADLESVLLPVPDEHAEDVRHVYVYARYLRAKTRLRQTDVTSTAAPDTCNTASAPAPSPGNVELAKTLVADARRAEATQVHMAVNLDFKLHALADV
eukprot:Tamp_17921.p1 GENE.Tamp_17921~~Tamp_17921.p1  ORF type:complete len:380 (-),score=44.47 Tamp_17921:222-1361(-)